ncbi:MAG: hemerythrin domain-containing protein [Thermodesulfobacteriota bacterium]
MQARAPLMIEHRLIEKMLALIERKLVLVEETGKIDPFFVDIAVDFIRSYADRTHHGKEEDILFSSLERKPLKPEHRRIMNELIEEHIYGRGLTAALEKANTRYRNGDEKALAEVIMALSSLTGFYPKHIDKEDRIFFPAVREYYSDEEDQALLREFWEFDRKMIHEMYRKIVEKQEAGILMERSRGQE